MWGQNFHPGVIGIVASRLLERYNKPALVISLQNGEGKGSGRSVPGFNLHSAIGACAPLLVRFGGHAMAAGFSVLEDQIEAFRAAINAYAAKEHPVLKAPPLQLDIAIRLDELAVSEVQGLDYLAPCGNANPAPLFFLPDAVIDGIYPVSDGRHTRLRLRQGGSVMYAAYFGIGPARFVYAVGQRVDVALTVSLYEGKNGTQFSGRVREIRPAGLPDVVGEQVALYQAFSSGAALSEKQKRLLLPTREHIANLYRTIRGGTVFSEDLQPLFAAMGPENTGKTLAGLRALRQIGLIEVRLVDGANKFVLIPTSGKRDLFSAPVLRALEG